MRFYISGPITGTEDYMDRFKRAQEYLESQGHTVINPALVNTILPKDVTYDEFMRIDFELLDMCEAMYMLDGWKNSPGANREHGYGRSKDYLIVEDDMPLPATKMTERTVITTLAITQIFKNVHGNVNLDKSYHREIFENISKVLYFDDLVVINVQEFIRDAE